MSGDYDDILEWPFHGEVTVELLNQLEDRHHHKEYFNFSESTMKKSKQRVIGTSRSATGVGKHQFIPHSQLFFKPSPIPFHNSQYLKDDTLYFRMSVKATPNKPWLST
jgi:TNF receptor-associated factor 4